MWYVILVAQRGEATNGTNAHELEGKHERQWGEIDGSHLHSFVCIRAHSWPCFFPRSVPFHRSPRQPIHQWTKLNPRMFGRFG